MRGTMLTARAFYRLRRVSARAQSVGNRKGGDMMTVTFYDRKSNRHSWRLHVEDPVELKDKRIEWLLDWKARLGPEYASWQIGYILAERDEAVGRTLPFVLKSNDPRIRRIV